MRHAPLSSLCLCDGNAVLTGKTLECYLCLAVFDAATGDDQRTLGATNNFRRQFDFPLVCKLTTNNVCTFREKR